MNEERFVLYEHKGNYYILENPREYLDFIEMLGDALTDEEIVDLLNKQQAAINDLKKEKDSWKNKNDCEFILCQDDLGNDEIRYDDDKIFHFLWEVAPLLNEQQAIINKLKEELTLEQSFASRWQRESEMLAKENEQLREELSECEKFRHPGFKRIEKTIENKKNCVINKDAKLPCKAYDECLKRRGTNKPLPCMVNWMMGRSFENMLRKEGDDE